MLVGRTAVSAHEMNPSNFYQVYQFFCDIPSPQQVQGPLQAVSSHPLPHLCHAHCLVQPMTPVVTSKLSLIGLHQTRLLTPSQQGSLSKPLGKSFPKSICVLSVVTVVSFPSKAGKCNPGA